MLTESPAGWPPPGQKDHPRAQAPFPLTPPSPHPHAPSDPALLEPEASVAEKAPIQAQPPYLQSRDPSGVSPLEGRTLAWPQSRPVPIPPTRVISGAKAASTWWCKKALVCQSGLLDSEGKNRQPGAGPPASRKGVRSMWLVGLTGAAAPRTGCCGLPNTNRESP